MLEAYGHGGDLLTARTLYGRNDFLDFSSNMNPYGPPSAVGSIIGSYDRWISAYPDPAVRELRRKLARLNGVDEANILVGNGAAELIDLVVRLLNPARTALAEPAFGEYGDAVRRSGGSVVPIRLREEQRFVLDASQLAALTDLPDLWFLGHPNNPTGQLLPPETLTALLQSGRPAVLDEAFIDFLPDADAHSLIRRAASLNDLYVIRSLTKFYAIPGIRLGYIVARPEAIVALRELQVPWSVNSLAQQIGCAVLDDIAYADKTRSWLAEELPWLTRRLQELSLTVYPGVANYVLVRLPDQGSLSAAALQQAMGRQGVLIRDASHFAGLDHRFVRLAVKAREDNEAMLAILARCLQEEALQG